MSPLGVYEQALRRAVSGRGAVLEFVSVTGELVGRVDTAQWTIDLGAGDESMLGRCCGATLDVGCGPGRLAAALHRRGQRVLGVDLCTEAVRQAQRRGAPAMRGDVFARLPMEGRWGSILLADGNIGIGGDPSRLLRRCTGLLDRGGRIVAEVHPPDTASWSGRIALQAAGERDAVRSTPFPWARVAARDMAELAARAGLRVADQWTEAGRWFAQLTR